MPRLTVARYEENFPGARIRGERLQWLREIGRFLTRHRRYPTHLEAFHLARRAGYRRTVRPTAPLTGM